MRHSLLGLLNVWPFSQNTLRLATVSLSFTVIAAAAQAQTVAALPTSSQSVAKVGTAKPIAAWTRFCQQRPEECADDVSEPATITLTPQAWKTIVQVNRQVNGAIKAKTDQDHWGVEDRWDFAEDGYGDCEDYQLVKRKQLVKAGFPRRALRMTVVIDEDGAGHAVMMVRTDRGDFVLDNKKNAVLPWHQTGYTYVKREGDVGSTWASLGGAFVSPTVTAGR